MGRNYDNWERLVAAVLLKEELRRLALCPSMEPSSISSESSRFSFSSSVATASPYDDRKLVYNELGLKFPVQNSDTTRNDINWERFSPPNNYQEITDSIPPSLNVFLDEKTGKKCYMLGARDLKISLASDAASRYREWRPRADSSFSEVAELQSNWRLDIRGKINTRILQPRNVYTAHLIFKRSERAEGLESAKVVIRFVNDESDREAVKRSKSVHFQPIKERKGEVAMVKGNMEIEMGTFYAGKGEDETVEARLLSIKGWKTGLIVQGILFQPTYVYSDVPLVSKQFMQRKSFSLDKTSGKKCFMIGARELIISWVDTQPYWKWTSHANSRFSEVAHLNSVCWLDIRGKIDARMLSQKTTYSAYLVFQLANVVYGLESVFAVIRFVNHEADSDAEDRADLLHLHRGHPTYRSPLPRQPGRHPVRRGDGWLEIGMGEFYNDEEDDGEVEARLLEIWRLHGKSGLIVEGIEFRPLSR